ncbi:MAG: HAL/PAL/TAL family ammonia-lyase [Solirubrobacteraceae bacterium]
MAATVQLTGAPLSPQEVAAVARHGAAVAIDPAAAARIERAAELVRVAARAGRPVYGLTTGLGSRVVEAVAGDDGGAFSLRTVRGRATAVGEPLPAELVRAAMLVRCNGICAGGSGAGISVAVGLSKLLNAGVHPRVPRSGSVGASDLCLMAHIGLTLIGEGEAELAGEWLASEIALARAGLAPTALGPKDGLAICSSSAVTAGTGALALLDAEACLRCAQIAAALTMEGFRANLSPIDPRVAAARPAPGQAWAASGLRALLAAGSLTEPGAARRLQDPISIRCASQIHGSLRVALDLLAAALEPELGGAADNPVVLSDDEEILSTGNFHVPALALALDTTAIALSQTASAIAERQARCRTERLSGLPHGLSPLGTTGSGLAPLGKTARALAIEIRHLAAPFSTMPTVGADGVEDDSTGASQGALRVREQLRRLWPLVAIELVVAAQAVTLAVPSRLGDGTGVAFTCVRELVPELGEDRPIGPDVERLTAGALVSGVLLERVEAALAR